MARTLPDRFASRPRVVDHGLQTYTHLDNRIRKTQTVAYNLSMAPHDLQKLIAGGETYIVEFKRDLNDDELTEAVVCLANGDGGWLLIGVENDGTVVGAAPRHGSTTQSPRVAALVANKTSPPLNVEVSVEHLDGVDIVVVRVPKASSVVATTSGRYVRRAIDVDGKPQCLPMLPHETQARTSALGVRDLSTLPLAGLSVDDLDTAELDRFRRLAAGGGDAILAELSDRDLLSALGLRSVDGVPTLGAALLFGTAEVLTMFAPTHAVVFQALDEHDAVQANVSLPVPMLRAMLELAEAVNRYNPEEEIDDGFFRLGLPRYSQVAVRELIANALVHRDYSLNGQVRVAVEGTTLSVSSPGGFPDGITIDNLLTAPPQARNPLIADAFKRAGLVERTGRGVNRVYRHQLALGRPQPDYSRSTRAWVEAQVPAGAADRELAAFGRRRGAGQQCAQPPNAAGAARGARREPDHLRARGRAVAHRRRGCAFGLECTRRTRTARSSR